MALGKHQLSAVGFLRRLGKGKAQKVSGDATLIPFREGGKEPEFRMDWIEWPIKIKKHGPCPSCGGKMVAIIGEGLDCLDCAMKMRGEGIITYYE